MTTKIGTVAVRISVLLAVVCSVGSASADSFYASFGNADLIEKFNGNGTMASPITLSQGGPVGLAVDRAGNLYVGMTDFNTIEKFSPTGVDLGVFATTGPYVPGPLAFDNSGNLYANINVNGVVLKFPGTGGAGSVFANLGANRGLWGLTFDSTGNLFVAEGTAQDVKKISPDGSQITTFATGGPPFFRLTDPIALVFDAAGNLLVADGASGEIKKYASNGTYLGVFASSPNVQQISGMVFDAAGTLYVSSSANMVIEKFSPAGVDLGVFANTGIGGAQAIVLVPEPSLLALASTGIVALSVAKRRRARI